MHPAKIGAALTCLGGTSYGGYLACGGGQLDPSVAINSHNKEHGDKRHTQCEGDACDHYLRCALGNTTLECGHKCVELSWYRLGLSSTEKEKVEAKNDFNAYDNPQSCPQDPTDKDFYRLNSDSTYYLKCQDLRKK